jgi:tetratricopeptide (TPR) repeat protein
MLQVVFSQSLGSKDYGGIPHRYLRLQVGDIIDSVKKLAASGPFAVEEPEGIHLLPVTSCAISIPRVDDPTIQHREVVAEALRILGLLQDDREKLPIQNGAFDMLNLSLSLHDLGMWQDAEIICTWAANLYRTLVRGNANPFLPYLALTLNNLAGYRHSIYDHKGALAASLESVAAYRMLNDTQTHHNVTQCLAGALGNYALALNHVHRFEDGLAAAQESVTIFRKLVCEDLETESTSTGSSCLDCGSEAEQCNGDNEEIPNFEPAGDKARMPTVIDNCCMLEYNLGAALHCLSICLSNAGRDSDAYDAAKEALDVLHSISEFYPGAFDRALARGLYHASDRLSTMDQPLDALPLMEEAVVTYRILAQKRPGIFSVDLIIALCKFATLLRQTGRHDDALAVGDEAVRLYRTLVGDRPDFLPYLPNAFHGIYSHLREVERHEEALAISTDTADIYRTLIRDFPSLVPSFAYGLHVLALQLRDAKRPEDALAVSKEAVDAYRTLAKDDPVIYTSDLAIALATLACSLAATRQYSEGLEAGKEAVELFRNDQTRPDLRDVFLMTLWESWFALRKAERLEDAIAIGTEVISTYRTLAEDRPTEISGELAVALLSSSYDLCRNGQYHDGLIASEEAVNLCRSFDGPHSACDFVNAVNDFGIGLYNAGRVEQAIAVCQEAITICRDIIGDHLHITSTLVSLLATLSDCASSRGQFNEALTSNEEAVSLSRSVPSENPSDLACELRELSVSLLNAGRSQDAMQASEEAVEICRNLPQSQDVSSALAYSLDSLSSCLADAGREEEALAAAEEAVTLYRQMTPNYILRTGCYDYNVADALYDFAARLAAAGRAADALANTVDAASIYRTVVTTRAVYLPKFATILHSLSVLLWEAGRQDEAIDAWKEEVTVRQCLASTNPDLVPMLHEAMCDLPARLSQAKPLAVVCDPLQLEQ